MKKILILALYFGCVNAYADTTTSFGEVQEVWSGYSSGKILFKLNIAHVDPKPCGSAAWYAVDPAKADADKFLSLLLTAQSTKSKVSVILSDTYCSGSYPVALRMGVKS